MASVHPATRITDTTGHIPLSSEAKAARRPQPLYRPDGALLFQQGSFQLTAVGTQNTLKKRILLGSAGFTTEEQTCSQKFWLRATEGEHYPEHLPAPQRRGCSPPPPAAPPSPGLDLE